MKKRQKVVFALSLIACIFIMAQACYASAPLMKLRGDKIGANNLDDVKREIDGKIPGGKRSAFNAWATLIRNNKFQEGAEFTYKEFEEMRIAFGKEVTGNSDYSISSTMLYNELNDLSSIVGVIERVSPGNYRVIVSMDSGQMQEINERYKEISSLRNVGLDSYDISRTTTSEEKVMARQIAGQVLASGQTIQTPDRDNPLNGKSYTKVKVLTAGQIMGPDSLNPELLAEKTEGVREGGNNLAIATTRNIKVDEAGNVSPEDEAYVSSILRGLPMEYETAKRLLTQRIIVFSYIPNSEMFAQIEDMAALATGNTLNNLTPAVARALVANI
ncbi:MAG: hypothetical protein KKD90_04175 [Candidatus Omnitrophica bacterium]|nr:hypothetical protein [Candidatus Omnitrophota bacterium]MBU4148876.1 hypothetical protein [Candidatus Omnitrophota bacterium]